MAPPNANPENSPRRDANATLRNEETFHGFDEDDINPGRPSENPNYQISVLEQILSRMNAMGNQLVEVQRQLEISQEENRDSFCAVELLQQQVASLQLEINSPVYNQPSASGYSQQPFSASNINHDLHLPLASNNLITFNNTPLSSTMQPPNTDPPHTNSAPVSSPIQIDLGSAVQHNTVLSTLTHKPFDLPEFCGFPEQWPIFIAAFKQSTEAFGYTPLQNVFRLQKCLKGPAYEAVQFLLINPNNVNDIIAALEFRFGRPEALAHSQREKIREIPAISESRIDRLIPLSSSVQNLVAFLNTDASRHILNETSLLSELVAKLPPSKQLDWIQHSIQFKPRATVHHFSSWLQHIAKCVSILNPQLYHNSSFSYMNDNQNKSKPRHILFNGPEATLSQSCAVCNKGIHTIPHTLQTLSVHESAWTMGMRKKPSLMLRMFERWTHV